MFILSEITTAFVCFDQWNDNYYKGEDVKIRAYFGNSLAVRYVDWHKEIDGGSHAIDKTLPKYEGTADHILMIRGCDESDVGTYFIQVHVSCTDLEICSNKLFLQVLKGKNVTLLTISLHIKNRYKGIHYAYAECATDGSCYLR